MPSAHAGPAQNPQQTEGSPAVTPTTQKKHKLFADIAKKATSAKRAKKGKKASVFHSFYLRLSRLIFLMPSQKGKPDPELIEQVTEAGKIVTRLLGPYLDLDAVMEHGLTDIGVWTVQYDLGDDEEAE